MIKFNNISKMYENNVKALSNVNIEINTGEFVFLVGPSGAGKSTFIKMLLKEVEPTTGTIEVGNVSTFLLSDMSTAITGQVIYADNGYNIIGA